MSEFDEVLARAVEAGTARGRLPGAADAVRRGRRRSLRTRGGVAVAGVAAVAGALGVTSALGGQAGAAPVGPGAGGTIHTDEGMLPAAQWPAYDVKHWKPHKINQGNLESGAVLEVYCVPVTKGIQSRKHVAFESSSDYSRPQLRIYEDVFTFADSRAAAEFMVKARAAVSPKTCPEASGTVVVAQGVSTADGVSWVTDQHPERLSGSPGYHSHGYLVQVDDRVALLQVGQEGADTYQGTAGDTTVLKNLEAALSR